VSAIGEEIMTMNDTTTHPKSPNGPPPVAAKPAPKGDRKKPERRERSAVEAATSRVMNLIGRLTPGDQRKVMGAVGALVSKADD
jgi:hypothetical protein